MFLVCSLVYFMHLRQVRALLPNENAAPQERHDLRDLATAPNRWCSHHIYETFLRVIKADLKGFALECCTRRKRLRQPEMHLADCCEVFVDQQTLRNVRVVRGSVVRAPNVA